MIIQNILFTLILSSIFSLYECVTIASSTSSIQTTFDSLFVSYCSTKTWYNVTKPFDNKPAVNMAYVTAKGDSTNTAKDLHDLSEFAISYVTSLRKDNSSDDFTVVTASSSLCPYKTTSFSCNSTTRYRSYDGSCNNLLNPLYGKTETPFKRYLLPDYEDSFNTQRKKAVSGNDLPNPRLVSTTISSTNTVFEIKASVLTALFGQFLAHDITGQSSITDSNGYQKDCPCDSTDSSCMSFKMPSTETVLNMTCMKFTRSGATFSSLDCVQKYREQLNVYSSYIDGSAIYGNSETKARSLRTFSGGLLKTSDGITSSKVGVTNRTYLPLSSDTCSSSNTTRCFFAGEHRTSENLGLVSVQTLFNREHNRIASKLSVNNPTWSDEYIYQETRRIVIAILQHIVYNEWLPVVTGNSTLSPLSTSEYYTGYDSSVNPAIANDFAASAFRFGHSLIIDDLFRYGAKGTKIGGGSFNIQNCIFKTDYAYNTTYGGINSILIGLANDRAWKFNTYANSMQNELFKINYPDGSIHAVDLLATNLNRGRDHGIPSYTKYLEYCLGRNATRFNDIKDLITVGRLVTLSSVYEDVNDIDAYAGGLSEIASNGVVGPTFSCIIMKQFEDLKKGDRFYYENGPSTSSTAFTLNQLTEIKKASMARLICDNYDVTNMHPKPFYVPATDNIAVACSTYSSIDLTKWTGN